MNKHLLTLFSLFTLGIQAQDSFPKFFKNSWKKYFKTRDEFVKHLREDQKRSVRSWAINVALQKENQERLALIDRVIKDDLLKQLAIHHLNSIHTYNPDEIYEGKTKICLEVENNHKELSAHIKNIFNGISPHNMRLTVSDAWVYRYLLGYFMRQDSYNDALLGISSSTNPSYSSIRHEAGHLAFNHHWKRIRTYVLCQNYSDSFPENIDFNILREYENDVEPDVTSKLSRQQEYSADIFAVTHDKCALQWVQRSYLFIQNPAGQTHPSGINRYKLAKDIYKLIQAEERWFKTPKADEMYGNVAYERAWVKHCEQLEQQQQNSKLKQWFGYFKKAL